MSESMSTPAARDYRLIATPVPEQFNVRFVGDSASFGSVHYDHDTKLWYAVVKYLVQLDRRGFATPTDAADALVAAQ